MGFKVDALLDSGCSDNLISEDTAQRFDLHRYPLPTPIPMQLANGTWVQVTQYVRPVLRMWHVGPSSSPALRSAEKHPP